MANGDTAAGGLPMRIGELSMRRGSGRHNDNMGSGASRIYGVHNPGPQTQDEETQRKATADDYRKNPFLMNLLESKPSEEQEPKQTKPVKPQNPNTIRDSKGNIKKGSCWYDVRGKLLYCE